MIENMEAFANVQFVHSSTMPKEGNWEALETMGIVNLGIADDICYHVKFPDGWTKILATSEEGDYRTSFLVDSSGNKRAGIFYKFTPYDRSAYFWIV